MFSSDVTARGLDYPDVTSVIQVGITSRDSYIHRLGRTARAGKEGKGTTILAPYEVQSLAKDLADIPLIHIDNDMANKEISLMQGNEIMNKLESSINKKSLIKIS
jgi:superfamily II DNA/RNA helicase